MRLVCKLGSTLSHNPTGMCPSTQHPGMFRRRFTVYRRQTNCIKYGQSHWHAPYPFLSHAHCLTVPPAISMEQFTMLSSLQGGACIIYAQGYQPEILLPKG